MILIELGKTMKESILCGDQYICFGHRQKKEARVFYCCAKTSGLRQLIEEQVVGLTVSDGPMPILLGRMAADRHGGTREVDDSIHAETTTTTQSEPI